MNEEQIAEKYDIPSEFISLVVPGAMVYKRLIEVTEAELLWLPGVRLGDGIVAEFAEQKKLIHFAHDFSRDILVAARNIAKRYMGDKEHSAILEKNVLNILEVCQMPERYSNYSKLNSLLTNKRAVIR